MCMNHTCETNSRNLHHMYNTHKWLEHSTRSSGQPYKSTHHVRNVLEAPFVDEVVHQLNCPAVLEEPDVVLVQARKHVAQLHISACGHDCAHCGGRQNVGECQGPCSARLLAQFSKCHCM